MASKSLISIQYDSRVVILGFSGIRTQIVVVEGEHADHFTTTTTTTAHRKNTF